MLTISKEETKLSIGKNVKNYRMKRGLNQRELALIAEMSSSTVSDIERDIKNPSVRMLIKLAKALRCTTDDLLKE